MTAKKVEVGTELTAATKARDDAVKARNLANHAKATVAVATANLATTQETAAKHLLAADEAEKAAVEQANKAREELEKSLGMVAHEEHVVPKESPTPEAKP